MCDSRRTLSRMVTKPLWRVLRLALVAFIWLASVAGATRYDMLRVFLMALPWFENPWVWVFGLTISTAVISVEMTAWWLRRAITRVAVRINRQAKLLDDPHKRSMRKWVHSAEIENVGTRDIDANCLVKLTSAWNEAGYSLQWLPFNLRPINQIREGRNQPFNLRRGERKTIVVGFSFTLTAERNWVEFVDGDEPRRVTFDSFLTRWLVVSVVAFGGGPPCRATGIFTLNDKEFSFRPRRSYEVITKSWTVAMARWAYRHYGRAVASTVQQWWVASWPRAKEVTLACVAWLQRMTARILKMAGIKQKE